MHSSIESDDNWNEEAREDAQNDAPSNNNVAIPRRQNQVDQTEHHINDTVHHENTSLIIEESQSSENQKSPNTLYESASLNKNLNPDSEHQSRQHKAERFWIMELLCLLLAVGSFVAILAILRKFEGNLQPNWRHGITINGVIAVLATLLRAVLAMIAEEAISQAKWLWYNTSRPVNHLSFFDEASRGPLGSLLLFFRIPQFNASSIGALIIILSLAISVFTQQAILAVPCEKVVPNINVSLPLGNTSGQLPTNRYGPTLYDIDPTVKINIINGLTNPSANRSVSARGCITGNCTFESVNGITHSFVGVCGKCVDTSSGIFLRSDSSDPTNPYTNLSICAPGGYPAIQVNTPQTLQSSAGNYFDSSPLYIPSNTDIESILPSALLNLSIISQTLAGCTISDLVNGSDQANSTSKCSHKFASIPDGLDPSVLQSNDSFSNLNSWNFISTSCVLYPCIRNSFANVTNGNFFELTVNEVAMQFDNLTETSERIPSNYVGVNEPCIIDGASYVPSNYSTLPSWTQQNRSVINGQEVPISCVYSFDATTAWGLSEFLESTLNAGCYTVFNTGTEIYSEQWALCSTNSARGTLTGNAIWLQSLFNRGNATVETIDAFIQSMATAISDSIRLQGAYGSPYDMYVGLDSESSYGNLSRPTILYGLIFQTDVCVQVNWRWLTLPALLIVLTTILLLIAIVNSVSDRQKHPIWKSSILPLLYATPGTRLTVQEGSLRTLEKDAERRRICLAKDEGRWEFMEN